MGLLGYVAAGALQGLGTGIQNDALQRREEALEAMRQRFKADSETRALTARANERAQDQKDRLELEDRRYQNKGGLLAIGGQVQSQRDEAQHGYKMSEIKQTQVGQQELAQLNSRLSQANTAAELKLRDSLQSGDISNVVRGQDGQYYGVTDNGLVATGVAAAVTDANEVGGGRLTESEQQAAFDDDRKAWREGGKQGPEPKKSDYIGMTRQAYSTRSGKSAPAPQASDTQPVKTQGDGQMSDKDLALSQLATSYASATPERYPGLFRNGRKIPFNEARKVVEQRYR